MRDPGGKVAVVYYSQSKVGNTATVAKWIAKHTGGELVPIETVEAYPDAYGETLKAAKKDVSPLVFTRDLPVMVLLTLSIGIFGFNIRNPRSSGTISRPCGIIWLAAFLVYLILLVRQEAFIA